MTIWNRFRNWFSPPVFDEDADKTRVAALVHVALVAAFSAIVAVMLLVFFVGETTPGTMLGLAIGAGFFVLIWFVMRSGRVSQASYLLLGVVYFEGTALIYLNGTIVTTLTTIYLWGIAMAGLFVGVRALAIYGALCMVTLFGLLQAETAGLLVATEYGPAGLTQWIAYVALYGITALLLGMAIRRIEESLARARSYAQDLEERRVEIQSVAEGRARELARQASYLGATTSVAREAAAVRGDIERLLRRTVEVIAEQFGFYHVGLFMLDPDGETVELRAASSEGGRVMLARGHRLRVGQGIVGTVAQQGAHRIALHVSADAAFVPNPDLPETQAEMAVPLRARGVILGALDAQSTVPDAFTDEDVVVVQALADQVALAIDGARLFQQVEESAEVGRRAMGELTRERWVDLLRAQPDLGYLSDEQQTVPAGELWRDEMRDALRTGQAVHSDEDEARLAVPVRVRDQVVGVIDGRKRDGTPWSSEERELLEAMVEQLNVALEGAQLYREAQRRAVREQRIAEITDRMRQSADMESLVRTTVEQLSALGRSGAFVQFVESPTEDRGDSSPQDIAVQGRQA